MATRQPKSSSSKRTGMGDREVGSFMIEEEIGKGSFATVYRGYQRQSRAIVAIKSVNLSKLNKKLKENLYSEIDILKGLQHPHILALLGCEESDTHIHLVMEFCELGDLSFFIKKRDKLAGNPATAEMAAKYPNPHAGGLNEVITRHFLKQLSSALEFLRARNFIHRDVKPQNLLLLPSPQFLASVPNAPLIMSASAMSLIPNAGIASLPMLKLADFGFARSLPSTSLAETLCGSPLYMAPEILRYEKYDAKADLWSVGTVLYEMMTGKPPFRASNHVELLRKIEQGNDEIKFPRDSVVSSGMKSIIRGLLKRNPVERISFENFFGHDVVKETIPGLMGEDRPKEIRTTKSEDSRPMVRTPSRRDRAATEDMSKHPSSPRLPKASPTMNRDIHHIPVRQTHGTSPRNASDRPYSNSNPQSVGRRPNLSPAATAPNKAALHDEYRSGRNPLEMIRHASHDTPSPGSSLLNEVQRDRTVPRKETDRKDDRYKKEERDSATQDAIDHRDYVIIEKVAVDVNQLADEMAANPRSMGTAHAQSLSPRSGQMTRRATTQGAPASVTGAVQPSASRGMQIAQGKPRPEIQRHSSSEKYGSPTSTTSAISKAIAGASLRLFGIGYSPLLGGRGQSPPQMYSPFPAFSGSPGIMGLIGEGRSNRPIDEDNKVAHDVEESATRSDVVYGFAEVKYKQLIPLAPSMDHGLGGGKTDDSDSVNNDDGLTPDAVVSLSEEALVLYVKALSLLAKSMGIASVWWARKGVSARNDSAGNRINNAVQWVRSRFNEVLEKAEFARLKLLDAQKQLPLDHPGHPSNHASASKLTGGTNATTDVVLSSGVTAEKLMYDRALEMSRTAAINEIANQDLPGCEISYITAIRMLEAVLEIDDDTTSRKTNNPQIEENKSEEAINGVNIDDRQAVLKIVNMVRARLLTLRKKMAVIAKHQSHPHSLPQQYSRPSSNHSGGTTPTIVSTPPK